MTEERRANCPHWFVAEDAAAARRLPFALALDSGEVVSAIEPQRVPHVLLLDRTGTVRHEGPLEGPDLWDALAGVSA